MDAREGRNGGGKMAEESTEERRGEKIAGRLEGEEKTLSWMDDAIVCLG